MTPDEQRRMALLETTLREVLRIAAEAEQCDECVRPSHGFVGVHGRAWRDIMVKARALVKP